jgi:hypothetical protein
MSLQATLTLPVSLARTAATAGCSCEALRFLLGMGLLR